MTESPDTKKVELEETYPIGDKQHPLVPKSSVARRAMLLVIAIMAFLASLTLGAVSLVNDTARGWQSDIAKEVTIQVRPLEGENLEDALLQARQIAGSMPGVESVRVIDEAGTAKLLEPWLGAGLSLDDLPVPRLISVQVDVDNPPDFDALSARLVLEVPGASLDDHRSWVERLNTMARATILSGLIILALVLIATVLNVVFATRGAMAGTKEVIEVLHFVGAEQAYIAKQFQWHFLVLGLIGAVAGGFLAIIVFLSLGFWATKSVADPTADQMSALFGTFAVGPSGYIATVLLIFGIAGLTALTSRFTVLKHLNTLDGTSGWEK